MFVDGNLCLVPRQALPVPHFAVTGIDAKSDGVLIVIEFPFDIRIDDDDGIAIATLDTKGIEPLLTTEHQATVPGPVIELGDEIGPRSLDVGDVGRTKPVFTVRQVGAVHMHPAFDVVTQKRTLSAYAPRVIDEWPLRIRHTDLNDMTHRLGSHINQISLDPAHVLRRGSDLETRIAIEDIPHTPPAVTLIC